MDLSHNRLEGSKGGAAISRIISRGMNRKGGSEIQVLNLSYNKLGDMGFAAITHELLNPDTFIETLNIGFNGMQ